MKVKDVMTHSVVVIPPDATLQEAAEIMREADIGCLPVCDELGCVGIITDRDIAVRCTADGRDPSTTQVRQAMTLHPIGCSEDDDIAVAATIMEERQIRRLVVVDERNVLVGIVSLGDLAVETPEQLSGEVLKGVSQGVH